MTKTETYGSFLIDQMALADIGHPRSLAREVHRQLRTCLVDVPYCFPLEEFAKSVSVECIEEIDSNAIDGILLVKDGRAIIGISRNLSSPRKRFTLAHELGHLLIPSHLGGKIRYQCSREQLALRRPKHGRLSDTVMPAVRKEIEANEFAAELLVPEIEFAKLRGNLGLSPDLSHIEVLSRKFAVSKEMMARTYVDRARTKVAILIHRDGLSASMYAPKDFPFLGFSKGNLWPSGCHTAASLSSLDRGELTEVTSIDPYIWFDADKNVSSVTEQAWRLGGAWSMTLLKVETRDDMDDEELLRPADRMWSGQRAGRFSWDS